MASEMQERLAKAIYEGRNGRGCAPWGRLPGSHKAPYLADALAAMEAMREPTPGMLDAGVAYALNVTLERAGGWSEYIRAKHRHMLDAEIEAAKKG